MVVLRGNYIYLHSKQEVSLLNKRAEKLNVLSQQSRKRWELVNLPTTTTDMHAPMCMWTSGCDKKMHKKFHCTKLYI
jgi:hypothetical protein